MRECGACGLLGGLVGGWVSGAMPCWGQRFLAYIRARPEYATYVAHKPGGAKAAHQCGMVHTRLLA